MKNKLFPFLAAFFLMLIFAADTFPQNKSNTFEETRPRINVNKSAENTFDLEKKAFALINHIRRMNNLRELVWNDEVAKIARQHSNSMASNKFFSHRGLDGSMIDDRADAIGLKKWKLIGENIAYNRGYAKPAEFAVECWMKSQGHRENLLTANWKETGIGIAIASDGSYYFTQVFLQRK